MMIQVSEDQWMKPEYALSKNKISLIKFYLLIIYCDGYLLPNPNCKECSGLGRKRVKINFGENAEETYVGMCSICGEHNGIAFVYPPEQGVNMNIEEYRKPVCINRECSNYYNEINWINVKELE